MADVLFINPRNYHKKFHDMPPLGMISIATFLKNNNVSVQVIDLEVQEDSIENLVSKYKPLLVCVGGTTETRFESFRIAKEVKRQNNSITVVYGGPHASCAIQDTLINIPWIDFIVYGEGEETVLSVYKSVENKNELKKTHGLAYCSKGSVFINPSRKREQKIDKFFLDYSLLPIHKYDLKLDFTNRKAFPVITSRGCPFNCAFCAAGLIWGGKQVRKSVQKVVDDLEYLLNEYNVSAFKFFDSTLTANRKYVEDLCAEIRKRHLDIVWECESRVDVIDDSLLKTLKSAGCRMIDMGLESASQRVLNTINKQITPRQAERALIKVKKAGLHSKMFFIYGLPGESLSEAKATYNFIKKNRKHISRVSAGVCTIYPGTGVENYAKKHNLLNDFSWAQRFYKHSYLKDFEANPHVPKLIQPQLGYETLKCLFRESYKENFSLKMLRRKIKDIGTSKGLTYSIKSLKESILFKLRYLQ